MSDKSSIEWTDATWNPVTGCTKVSPGCAHCYAETVATRFWPSQYVHTVERGFISVKAYNGDRMDGRLREFTDVMCHSDRLDQPLRWRKPKRVFVNSMSDLFHEDVPDDFIDRVLLTIVRSHNHVFQVLTKRPDRMRRYFSDDRLRDRIDRLGLINHPAITPRGKLPPTLVRQWPLPTLWLGVSVENQHFADERIPLLLQTPAAVRFISAEPLLGPVDLHNYLFTVGTARLNHLHWVIVGGESGPGARPFDLAWARSIVAQCHAAGVACFVKQLGANATCRNDERDEPWPGCTVPLDDDYEPRYQGEMAPLVFRSRKGGDPDEWPADLRVREFPRARA